MTLFNEHPDEMTGKTVNKPRTRDMLFERLLSIFHPSLTLDAIPDTVRARLNKACKKFREWPGFDMSEVMVRYGRMKGRTRWTTALALANHWDEFGDTPENVTRQPGMPSQAEQDAQRQSNEMHRRQCEEEQAGRDKARLIVQAAPGGVADALLKEWREQPENEAYVKRGYGKSPTDRCCVRWIAEQLEARNV